MQKLKRTRSHPAIRFEHIPVVPGPLNRWEKIRPDLLGDVVVRTQAELSGGSLELLLGEALYKERMRLRRNPPNLFTRSRAGGDAKLWNRVQGGLLKPAAESDRKELLQAVISHYSEEIGGHFKEGVYKFAIEAVPWGFSWLLNAASLRRFLPWGMTESLRSRLNIVGEVSHLKKLAEKGTILLVPTHQSNIDSILIGYVIYLMSLPPFSYGAGLNLFSNPLLSFFMSNLGAYTVDRQKSNDIYKQTLKNYSARVLREGVHSIFFPGGGRAKSGAVESRLKLGLLGTALEAQIENYREGKPNPSVFIVPMVMSYHFVLEASSLIEDYLADAGKHRFINSDEEAFQPWKVLKFFWKLFSSKSGITVRIGKPLDIFGNFVDEQGVSMGPNGTKIDPKDWLTTQGELKPLVQRDNEYVRELGAKIAERFHVENTVLTSHLVAFSYFEFLRAKYPDLDLFRFLRLSLDQRSFPFADYLKEAEKFRAKLLACADRGELYLSEELRTGDAEAWVRDGMRNLGFLHEAAVVRERGGVIWTEDMNLLYYYRNRLSGYGLTAEGKPGDTDAKGFLA